MKDEATTGARADAIEILVSDHREVTRLVGMLLASKAEDTAVRDDLRFRITAELMKHAAAEEEIVYPALREVLSDGNALADDGINEHQEIERMLDRIEEMDIDAVGFIDAWRDVSRKLAHHIKDEETKDFPQLRDHLDEARLMEMGERLARAKQGAPTHPHPMAPTRPPLNVPANAAAALVDRFRDLLRS